MQNRTGRAETAKLTIVATSEKPQSCGLFRLDMSRAAGLRVQRTCFSHPKLDLPSRLGHNEYISGVSILLPVEAFGGEEPKQDLVRELASAIDPICGSFFSLTAPLHVFLNKRFLDVHVRDAAVEFVLLSKACASGSPQDMAAISPAGSLDMAVTRDTFQQLGIPGMRSRSSPGELYHISVDLKSRSFRPGKPLHDRVLQSLLQKPVPLNLVCAFTRNGRPVTPAFPSEVLNITTHTHKARHSATVSEFPSLATLHTLFASDPVAAQGAAEEQPQQQASAMDCPSPRSSSGGGVPPARGCADDDSTSHSKDEVTRGALSALYNWIGTVCSSSSPALNVIASELTEALSVLGAGPDVWRPGRVHQLRIQGALTPQQIALVVGAVRSSSGCRDMWSCVCVWGQLTSPRDVKSKGDAHVGGPHLVNSCFLMCGEDLVQYTND